MIGFAGLGDLGSAIVTRLVTAGHDIMVWNRTGPKADPVVALGARRAMSLEELYRCCSIVGLCLTSHEASLALARTMWTSTDALSSRRVIVDFSTGSPKAAVDCAREAADHDAGWVDAPVSGGIVAALEGRLTLFLGGNQEDIDRASPLLESISAHRTRLGGSGAGQSMKLCNQMLVGCMMLSIAETLSAARKAGLDVALLTDVMHGGFADTAALRIFGPRMAARQHAPRLGSIGLMTKDLILARNEMRKTGSPTPLADLCISLYQCAGEPDADISELIHIFEGAR